MSTLITVPPLLFLTALSSYGIYLSYHNITRLQKYEEKSEKAAEWSNTAAERLHKTRTTQGSAAITIALSFLTSLTLLGIPSFHAEHHNVRLGISLVNTAILAAARIHVGNFWNDRVQTQVPFVEKFNEAIKGSETLVTVLGVAAWTWGGAGVVWWILG